MGTILCPGPSEVSTTACSKRLMSKLAIGNWLADGQALAVRSEALIGSVDSRRNADNRDDLMGPYWRLGIFLMVPARFYLVDLVTGGLARASKNSSYPVAIRSFLEAFGARPNP